MNKLDYEILKDDYKNLMIDLDRARERITVLEKALRDVCEVIGRCLYIAGTALPVIEENKDEKETN